MSTSSPRADVQPLVQDETLHSQHLTEEHRLFNGRSTSAAETPGRSHSHVRLLQESGQLPQMEAFTWRQSGFGWRSWANPGGTRPCPLSLCQSHFLPWCEAAQHKPFPLRAQPQPAVTKITQTTSHHQNPPVSPRLTREGNN